MAINIGTIEGAIRLRDDFSGVIESASAKLQQASTRLQQTGQRMAAIGTTLSTRITAPLVAVGTTAIVSFGNFDQAMTNSLAIMGDVSTEMRDRMAVAARQAAVAVDGNAPSATAAAEAYFFLASAGKNAEQSIALLPPVTQFAKAGNFDLALATDLLTDAQSALRLSSKDVATDQENLVRVSDVLVKANTLANASVQQFSESLTNKAGNAMAQLHIEIESGVAVLAAWADQGVKGQVAGERFGIVTRDLTKIHREHKDELDRLGIAVFDASGNFRNMSDIIVDLENATRGMSDEQVGATLATLGFQNRSIQATQSLIGLSGKIKEYEINLRSAGGITAEVAEKQMASLWSRLELLKNRFINSAAAIAEQMIPAINSLISIGASALDWFDSLSSASQGLIVGIGALAAAIGPVIFIFGQLAITAGALGITMAGVGTAISTTLGVIFGPVGLIVAGTALLLSWKPARDFLWDLASRIFTAVKDGIMAVIRTMRDWWDATAKAREFLAALARVIVDDVIRGISNFASAITSIARGIVSFILDIKDWIRSWELTQIIIDTVKGAIETVSSWIQTLAGYVRSAIRTVSDWVGGWQGLLNMLNFVAPALGAVIGKISEWVGKASDAVRGNAILVRSARDVGESADDTGISIDAMDRALANLNKTSHDTPPVLDKVATGMSEISREAISVKLDIQTLDQATGELTTTATSIARINVTEVAPSFVVVSDATIRAAGATDRMIASANTFGETMGRIGGALNQLQGPLEGLLGERGFGRLSAAVSGAQHGAQAYASFMSGDFIGGITNAISAIEDLGKAFDFSGRSLETRVKDLFEAFANGEDTIETVTKLARELSLSFTNVKVSAERVTEVMNNNFSNFVDIAREFGDEGVAQIQRVVAAAQQAGLGLETIAEKLREVYEEAAQVLEERSRFLIEQATTIVDSLDNLVLSTASDIEFASSSITVAFQSMIEAGMPMSEVIANIGDTFDDIRQRAQRLGITTSDEFNRFGEVMDILADGPLQGVIDRLTTIGDITESVGNVGRLTEQQFRQLDDAISGTFIQLTEGGLLGSEALRIIAPELQTLLNLSEQYGIQINDNTLALIDEATASGLVASQGMTTEDILIRGFDRMLEGINALIVALGGVPVAFESWVSSSIAMTDSIQSNFNSLGYAATTMSDGIETTWRDVNDSMAATFSSTTDMMSSQWSDMTDSLGNTAADTFNEVARFTDELGNFMTDRFRDIPVTFDIQDDGLSDLLGTGGGRGGRGRGGGRGGVPERPDFRFAKGSQGFLNFGKATPVELHGREEVVTEHQGISLAGMVGGAIDIALSRGRQDVDTVLRDRAARGKKPSTFDDLPKPGMFDLPKPGKPVLDPFGTAISVRPVKPGTATPPKPDKPLSDIEPALRELLKVISDNTVMLRQWRDGMLQQQARLRTIR